MTAPSPRLLFPELLAQRRDAIVERFVSELQESALAPAVSARGLLEDHIPRFLDEIVAELKTQPRTDAASEAEAKSGTAREHGEQRWELGYELGALVREYGVLRRCILHEVAQAGLSLSIREFDALAKCFNVGVAEAVEAYVAHRDHELESQRASLAFLAEAGQLLTSSLDYPSTLTRLTGLIVPRLADWCAVYVDGMAAAEIPIAHVAPERADAVRELYQNATGAPVPGELAVRHVMQTGEPLLIAAISESSLARLGLSAEHLHALLALAVDSCLVVPLVVQGNMFGALTLAYAGSGRRYGESDLLLASELARRAATAIDNAKLFEESQRARSRIEAADRAKDEFVATVSHELRTPLTAILGWTRLLRGGEMPAEKQSHALEVIERNATMQNQVIADLLDISRTITGKIRIHPTQVDVGDIVEMAIEGARPAAAAKRIEIVTGLDRQRSIVHADGERLQQVVWSLLSNAVKFTPKNGNVRVALRNVESDIELVVEDNGQGIAPEFLPHVFESFRQSDSTSSRTHGGLGIGLSIAKHLVELHGGSLSVHSEGLHRGARFVVRLPISSLVSTTIGIARLATRATPAPDVTLPVNVVGLTVLVVDDEPDARELVGYVLSRSGITVHLAASAADALSVLEQVAPDVMVSDVGMPGEDGYALIRSIRTSGSERARGMPAIALTAFATNQDRTRALVEGFNMHMAKPVEPAHLVAAVLELSGHPQSSSVDP